MSKKSKLLCLLWLSSLLSTIVFGVGCQRSRAGITVAGSTSVEPFAELLAEEYMMRYPQIRIYVQGGGSTAGIEAVRTRAAQIGLSSRSLTSGEKDLYAVTIAKDAIAIIVHPKNPVQNLPLENIIGVFSGKVRGDLSRITGPGFQWGHPAGCGRRSKCHRLYLPRTGERESEGSQSLWGRAQSEKHCQRQISIGSAFPFRFQGQT
jgi:ABC-type phosphate transport system substrate-binding protein